MKKSIKILFIILMLLFCTTRINALDLSQSEYEEYNIKRAYVVGKYIFDLSKHNPTLKDLMLAAQSSPTGDVSIIEIKIATNINGEETKEYRELLDGTKLTEFPKLDVKYIYSSEVMPETPDKENKIILEEIGSGGEPGIPDQPDEPVIDTTSPSCTWPSLTENLAVDTTAVITLTCTDDSGIKTSTLTSSAFTINGDFTIQSIQTETITNGYKYNLTLKPSKYGYATISLKENQVKDKNENGNATVTSETFNITETLIGTFNLNGEKAFKYQNKEYTQADINKVTLNGQTSIVFKGTTYTATELETICSSRNNNEVCALKLELCTITNGSNCSATLPEIIPSDETGKILGFSFTTNIDATVNYYSGETVTISSNLSGLYSQVETVGDGVEATVYTATFMPNGGEGSEFTKTCTVVSGATSCEIELPANSFTFDSWEFNNWSTDASSKEGTAPTTKVTLTDNVRYYALWKKIAHITVKANGCAVQDKVTYTSTMYNGSTNGWFMVPTVSMNDGWISLGVSQSASSMAQGVDIGATSGMTIYVSKNSTSATAYYNCKKEEITYTASFNANGGAGAPENKKCTIPAVYNGDEQEETCSIILPQIGFERIGWTFNGWGRSGDSTNGVSAGSGAILAGDTEYYASWKKEITVKFQNNGCTTMNGTTTAIVYNGATTATITIPIVSMKTNWVSLGASASATSTDGTAMGTTMKLNNIGETISNVEMFYNCKKDVTITFEANGCATSDKKVTTTLYNGGYSTSVTVPSATMNAGWKSLGASPSRIQEINGTVFGGEMSIIVNSEDNAITRYYNCKKDEITYTATFNPNGGTGVTESQECTIPPMYNGIETSTSCKIQLPTSRFSRNGWTFNGWGSNETSTNGVSAGTEVVLAGDIEYYATWVDTTTP